MRRSTLASFALVLAAPLGLAGAPFRGVLVDESDGALVPHYALDVIVGEATERVVSDAQGKFASKQSYEAGEVRVQPIDVDTLKRSSYLGATEAARMILAPKRVAFDPAKEVTLAIEVGPTYRLQLAPAPATLPEGAVARLWAEPLPGAAPEVWSVVAPLRSEGGGTWARFDSFPKYVAQASSTWRVSIEVPSGLWSGSAPVTSLRGVQDEPLSIAMSERARWSGGLRTHKGAAVPLAWVTLERLGDVEQVLEARTETCDWEGRFAFSNLEPGRYRLRGDPLRHAPFKSLPRALKALEDAKLDLTLEPLPVAGVLAGRLESKSGTFGAKQGEVVLALRRLGESAILERKTPEWLDVAGRKVAAFTFDALPAGEFEVEVRTPLDVTLDVAKRRVAVPSTEVVFTVLDG